jgi:60 kDa SS-A/Ro ribonucleoprotein
MVYSQHYSTKATPQRRQAPNRPDQVQNNAGGFVWEVDKWTRLARFLILGSEGGSYYVGEKDLTIRNANSVRDCLKEDGALVVKMATAVSEGGRAPSNDPALFVLAMACSPDFADLKTRKAALEALPKIARFSTHMYHFAAEVDGMRGWGRGLREAVAKWYTDKDADHLAYQAVKYQQRDNWSHRDLLRLSHPVPPTREHDRLFEWITQGKLRKKTPELVHAFEAAKHATEGELVGLIEKYNLPWEAVPTGMRKSKFVWGALLMRMPMTAMIRNLATMTRVGLLKPMSAATRLVTARLTDKEFVQKKPPVHPLAFLVALKTYQQGHGIRGDNVWDPVREIVDALDEAFYLSFGNVQPTGKRLMLALDVSGSMDAPVAGSEVINCREGAAAVAMITAAVEPNYVMTAFHAHGPNAFKSGESAWGHYTRGYGQEPHANGISLLNISPRQRMDDVLGDLYHEDFGATDCALPMLWAAQQGVEIDAFIIYTDNETWAGKIHPHQALNQYRNKSGIPAKLVSVAMTAGGFSVADPDDSGQMDVLGFDPATPNVIANFIGE